MIDWGPNAFWMPRAEVSEPVDIAFRWRGELPDPSDDMVLEAAINGRAEALVTFNPRHFAGVTEQFGLALRDPRTILANLGTGS